MHFCSTFNGSIPLAVQWYRNGRGTKWLHNSGILKRDFQYVTVSHQDGGPFMGTKKYNVPNFINNSISVFIFSAGGWGDVSVPLILGSKRFSRNS